MPLSWTKGSTLPRDPLWRLVRVDVRTQVKAGKEVIARVELQHRERGRLTDLATGHGGIEAAFRAIGQLLHIDAELENISVTGRLTDGCDWMVSACVTVRRGGISVPGISVAADQLTASCEAYLNALLVTDRCTP